MNSCCLSAGSLRFLVRPVPTEEFGFPYGGLTSGIDHPLDLIGVTLFRMCEIQLGRMPSLLRGVGVRSRDSYAHGDHSPIHHRNSRSDDRDVTQPHQRFICIHPSSFPLARLPRSARSFLGRYPSLSTPPLPVMQRGIGDSPGHWAGSLCSTQHKRPQIARRKSSA